MNRTLECPSSRRMSQMFVLLGVVQALNKLKSGRYCL